MLKADHTMPMTREMALGSIGLVLRGLWLGKGLYMFVLVQPANTKPVGSHNVQPGWLISVVYWHGNTVCALVLMLLQRWSGGNVPCVSHGMVCIINSCSQPIRGLPIRAVQHQGDNVKGGGSGS